MLFLSWIYHQEIIEQLEAVVYAERYLWYECISQLSQKVSMPRVTLNHRRGHVAGAKNPCTGWLRPADSRQALDGQFVC